MSSLPRHPLHLIKTEMCRFGKSCTKKSCSYAHTSSELRRKIPEEEYCRSWSTTGTCPFGTRCRFQKGHVTSTHQSHIEKTEPKKETILEVEPDDKKVVSVPIIEKPQPQEDENFHVVVYQPRTMSFIQHVVVPSCVPDIFAKFPQLDKVYPYFEYELPFLEKIDWETLVKCETSHGSLLKDLFEYGQQRPEFVFATRVVIMCLTGALIVKKSNLKD